MRRFQTYAKLLPMRAGYRCARAVRPQEIGITEAKDVCVFAAIQYVVFADSMNSP
jgi:hypothetical protein